MAASTMKSSSELASSGNVDRTQELKSIFTCSVCLGPFKLPLILPECGHSFCMRCLEPLRARVSATSANISCPECRTITKVSLHSPLVTTLQINKSLQQALGFYKFVNKSEKAGNDGADNETSDDDDNDEDDGDSSHSSSSRILRLSDKAADSDVCPHHNLVLEPTDCKHCHRSFCDVCLFRHLEQLRIELAWASSGLKPWCQTVADKLESNKTLLTIKSTIDEKTKQLEEEVNKEAKLMEEQLKSAIERFRETSIAKLHEIGKSEYEKAVTTVDMMAKEDFDQVIREVTQIANSSVLLCPSPDNFFKLNKQLLDKESKISEAEKLLLKEYKFDPKLYTLDFSKLMSKIEGPRFGVTASLSDSSPIYIDSARDLVSHPYKPFNFVKRLHRAVNGGNLEELKIVVERPDLPPVCRKLAAIHHNKFGEFKTPPLIEAVQQGHLAVTRYLVGKCGPIAPEYLSKALEEATRLGDFDILRALFEPAGKLQEGDDGDNNDENKAPVSDDMMMDVVGSLDKRKSITLDDDQSAKSQAAASLSTECLDRAIRTALTKNNVAIARYLLRFLKGRADFKVNRKPRGGKLAVTLLYKAAVDGRLEVVEFLVNDLKANVDTPRCQGKTPLLAAAKSGHFPIVKFLTEHGADLSARTHNGRRGTVLHLAAMGGSVDVVRYLLEQKQELIKETDDYRLLPVDVAEREHKLSVHRFLIKAMKP